MTLRTQKLRTGLYEYMSRSLTTTLEFPRIYDLAGKTVSVIENCILPLMDVAFKTVKIRLKKYITYEDR